MPPYANWKNGLWALALLLLFVLTVRSDLSHLRWAESLSEEGSPAPALDADSPTGYALGQRHFIATRNRGETYRWIAYTQELMAHGLFHAAPYEQDTAPEGRPQLMPKLYAAWLAAIAYGLHLATDSPLALAVESAALWEPLVSHALALLAVALVAWRRYGAAAAVVFAAFFAAFPLVSSQFIPGALSPLPWSLLLATYALAQVLPTREGQAGPCLNLRSAIAASLALWLNPSVGAPAILIGAAAALAASRLHTAKPAFLKWALAGAGLTLAAWLIDQNPLATEASELRYLHPLYAAAWLGIGLALNGLQQLRRPDTRRTPALAQIALSLPLVGSLAYVQISAGYLGWLHGGAASLRLASIDETQIFGNLLAWIGQANLAEAFFLLAPALVAVAALVAALVLHRERLRQAPQAGLALTLLALVATFLLVWFKVRWGLVASLLAVPALWTFAARQGLTAQRVLLAVAGAYLLGLFAWNQALPYTLALPSAEAGLRNADLEALAQRHFSHWLASHHPDQPLSVLAAPELSDSIVFHGGKRTLLSTAWESYPGQVAASRLLSAPEASEAEAILESRELTHVALSSWDQVLPLLVQAPLDADKNTLYDRLQRWVLPLFLKAVPYHLPPIPGYQTEKLAVFEKTPAQDEALALSRLAEYFVEMRRSEPAALVAAALDQSFPDDPNAAIARAFVYANAQDTKAFLGQLDKLAANVEAGLVPYDWDRRALRTIALALGRRHDLAKGELQDCLDSMTEEALYQLSPLQTVQFKRLVDTYGFQFPNEALLALANARCAEYLPK